MIKVEIFETPDIDILKNVVNTWLEDHLSLKIIDIKYQSRTFYQQTLTSGSVNSFYSAMIIYQTKGKSKVYGDLSKEVTGNDTHFKIQRKSGDQVNIDEFEGKKNWGEE